MGYCTDSRGRLCCDICGESGDARRVRCPFGYCPSTAVCSECRRKHRDKLGVKAHRAAGCERLHLEYVAREQERAALIASGKFLRRSALGLFDGSDRVQVMFEGKGGASQSWFMSSATYHAFELLDNVTVEQYASVGPLEAAPAVYAHGSACKGVA